MAQDSMVLGAAQRQNRDGPCPEALPIPVGDQAAGEDRRWHVSELTFASSSIVSFSSALALLPARPSVAGEWGAAGAVQPGCSSAGKCWLSCLWAQRARAYPCQCCCLLLRSGPALWAAARLRMQVPGVPLPHCGEAGACRPCKSHPST